MAAKYYPEIEQHTDEWFSAKCGVLSASNMHKIITAVKLEPSKAKDGGEIDFLYDLCSQRVNQFMEPTFQSFDMQRGTEEEILAKALYAEKFNTPIIDMGWVTNDKWGFTLGCSPDGLVGDDGFIESKSRNNKIQFKTIVNNTVPADVILQIQTEFLVMDDRKWCDTLSYSNGMNMVVYRMYPDIKVQAAILGAAASFMKRCDDYLKIYADKVSCPEARIYPVERRIEQEMMTTEGEE